MPVNRNALIRFKTLDKCFSNPYKQWTLEMLIEACSEALYEYEGIDKGVSRRTVQADIQIMRSNKLGYNAPIEVYEKRFYKYSDPEYSITNMPLSQQDLEKLTEVTDILRQFKGFSHFHELTGIVQKIEDKVFSQRSNTEPIIDIDKNEDLKGLEYLDFIYRAIIEKKVLEVNYQSFNAREPSRLIFHPCLLKEYNNRWFMICFKNKNEPIFTLALDRICSINTRNDIQFVDNTGFSAKEYYKNVVGVTVKNERPQNIRIFVDHQNAPYILTKPLHQSQELISSSSSGIEIRIKVIPNYELERLILGFGESMQILEPEKLRKRILGKLQRAIDNYSQEDLPDNKIVTE